MTDTGDHDVVLLRDRSRVQSRGLRREIREDRIRGARRDRDDAFAIIRHDVQAEAEARAASDLADRLVKWIALTLREAYARIFEKAHAVLGRDRGLAGAADRDRLAPARIAGVLVRLHDPGRDHEVRILHELLREARH